MLVNSSKLIQSIYNRYSEDQKFDEVSNGIKIMAMRFVENDIDVESGGGLFRPPPERFSY